MTVLHTGSTKKFAKGWEEVFKKGAKKAKPVTKKAVKKKQAKKGKR